MTDEENPRAGEEGRTDSDERVGETMAEGDEAAHQDHAASAPESEYGHGTKRPAEERTTAPQSPYSMRDVGIGVAVAAVGFVIAFVIPLLAA